MVQASLPFAKARAATIRRDLIAVAGREAAVHSALCRRRQPRRRGRPCD
jgi:hypothetical protein